MKLGTVQIFRKTILSAIVLIGFLVIAISDSSYQYDSPIRTINKWIGLIFIIVFIFFAVSQLNLNWKFVSIKKQRNAKKSNTATILKRKAIPNSNPTVNNL